MLNNIFHWTKEIDYKTKCNSLHVHFDTSRMSFESLHKLIEENSGLIVHTQLSTNVKQHKAYIERNKIHNNLLLNSYEAFHEESRENKSKIYYLRISESLSSNDGKPLNKLTLSLKDSTINQELINLILSQQNISSMMLSNSEVTKWNNRDNYNYYKYKRGLNVYKNNKGEKKIDLSGRPGRKETSIRNFTWSGAHEYWFGKEFYSIIPKRKLLQFKKADTIEKLNGDIIHVKLFPLEKYWAKESQRILQAFRNLLKVTELADEREKYYRGQRRNKSSQEKNDALHYRNFGSKCIWVIIKDVEPNKVLEYFNNYNLHPSKWKNARFHMDREVFVTDRIKDYVILMGLTLPSPDSTIGIDKVLDFIDKLSSHFGQVFYFGEYRTSNFVMWAKSTNGKTIRAYAYADTKVFEIGDPSDIEQEWNLISEIKRDIDQSRHPGIKELIEISISWIGIDLTQISSLPNINDDGILISI